MQKRLGKKVYRKMPTMQVLAGCDAEKIRQKSIPKNAYDAGFSRVCLYITLQCFWKQYVKDAFYYDRTVRKMERRLQQRNLLFVIR